MVVCSSRKSSGSARTTIEESANATATETTSAISSARRCLGAAGATSMPGSLVAYSAPVALMEREPQLEALDAALAATASAGAVVLVAGEAGIGKTALVRAFAERAPRRRARRLEPLRRPRRAAAARRGRDLAEGGAARSGRPCVQAGAPSCSRRSGRSWRACRGRCGSSRTSTGRTGRPSTC